MTQRPPRPLYRTARAVVFATVCVTLAVLGHVAAGGEPPPVRAAAAGYGAVLGVTLLLAGHERSLGTILGGLLGGQFALHTLFSGAAAPALHPMHPHHMHPHHMYGAGVHGDVLAPAAGHGGNGAVMTLAHCVAALVAAWWLRRGERAAWSLARRIAAAADRPVRLLAALSEIEPAGPAPRVRAVPAAEAPFTGRVLRHQVTRRGPPVRSRALASG